MLKIIRYLCVISALIIAAAPPFALIATARNHVQSNVQNQVQNRLDYSGHKASLVVNGHAKPVIQNIRGRYGVQYGLQSRPDMMRRQHIQRRDPRVYKFAQSRVADQRSISPSRAKSIAMRYARGAKFINVQLVGPATYRVRLQINARIIDVYVDAHTGQVRN